VRFVVALCLLVGVYALTLGSHAPLDLLTGALLGAILLFALRPEVSSADGVGPGVFLRRTLAFPRFAAAVLWEVLVGTWRVSATVLGRRPLDQPGLVAVPMGDRTPTGVAASGLALTLAPGECLVDVDWERRVMLIHVLDAGDPEAVRRQLAEFYDRHQRAVFP
jgi:multisubunit Na+/H+ antiporter MnhE subunit